MSRLTPNKSYFLLLIDIKKSTVLDPKMREAIFNTLGKKLQFLNDTLHPKPLLELQISYGDEIAGLFETPKSFYQIVCELREAIAPQARFRFAANYGKIGIASDDIREVGGEIFKQADALIKRIKKQDRFCVWNFKDAHTNEILDSLTEMSNTLLERMTPYQRSVWNMLRQGLTQKEIAKKLKKFPQSVSDAVKRSGADQVVRAGKTIDRILSTFDQ